VRQGHRLLAADITADRYAACGHVVASRRGRWVGPVDEALAARGLARTVVVVVPSFPAALAIACASDLVALVTDSFLAAEQARQAGSTQVEAQGFALPVPTPEITVSLMWHPRMDADPAHGCLRGLIHRVSDRSERFVA
jgi:DNA-binding transcriptional LysR family regulator